MSESSSVNSHRIRTFAKDLERARETMATSTTTDSVSDEKKFAVPKDVQDKEHKKPLAVRVRRFSQATPKSPEKTDVLQKKNTPSFHEIKKDIAKANEDNSRHKPFTAVNNSGFENATIIKETVRNRFNPLTAIWKAGIDWFNSLRNKKRKQNRYSVPVAQRRKGVIERATSKSGVFFTATDSSIRDRIKRRGTVKPKMDTEEIHWSPNTETVFPLLPIPAPVNAHKDQGTSIKTKKAELKKANAIPKPPTVSIPPPVITEPAPQKVTKETLSESEQVVSTSKADTNATSSPQTLNEHEHDDTAEVSADTRRTTEIKKSDRATNEQKTQGQKLQSRPKTKKSNRFQKILTLQTNTASLSAAIGIVAILAVVLVVIFSELTIPSLNPTRQSLVNTEYILSPVANPSSNEIYNALLQISDRSSESSFVLVPTVNNEAVSTGALLESLDFSVSPRTKQNILVAEFGSIQSQPFMIWQISDPTTVQGGLLEWESTIYAEIGPIVSVSNRVVEQSFRDQQLGVLDTRNLRTLDGNVVLSYSFVKENVVVFAQNDQVIAQVAAKIR